MDLRPPLSSNEPPQPTPLLTRRDCGNDGDFKGLEFILPDIAYDPSGNLGALPFLNGEEFDDDDEEESIDNPLLCSGLPAY